MSNNKELEIRHQFLDEAQEYLYSLDAAILGLADNRIDVQEINAALRAAHSIKGGAGLMGFEVLSNLAHRLEDSFKVLKVQKSVVTDANLENLLLSAISCLRHVIECDRQMAAISPEWLAEQAEPIFAQLHEILGEPQDEDAHSVLSPEDGQDIIPILFETEVEGCLQRLEAVLEDPKQPCLQEEVMILAQELAGLGEMLQLPAFTSLCESVSLHLEQLPEQVEEVARSALRAWRRSQALVMTGQINSLPTEITIAGIGQSTIVEPIEADTIDFTATDLGDFTATDLRDFTATDLEDFSTPVLPITQPQRNSVRESQVTDFKILENQSNSSIEMEEQDTTVRVSVRQLNQLNDLFGELAIDRNSLDLHLNRLRNLTNSLNQRLKTLVKTNAQLREAYDKTTIQSRKSSFPLLPGAVEPAPTPDSISNYQDTGNISENISSKFDVLEMDRYSDLHLLSQEVMETVVQIQEITSDIDLNMDDAQQTTRNLGKTAKQLQTKLTQVRMRPLSDVVDRFPRALRELSLQYCKPVRLNILGGNTLIDRNILEHLSDPLMHLLRNAFDHGIETPEVRKAHNKPNEGLIEICATHRSNRIYVTVRDDGNGIPLDKVRDRAERMGLDPTLLANASDEELLSLIFEPGFSTNEQVTALSGRGVGMDVVRDNLRRIRGEISVNTQAGIGTTFTLSVPLTLSIVRILLVESNGMLLAFPTEVIEEMFLLNPENITSTPAGDRLQYQDTWLELIHLSRWLMFQCPRQSHNLDTPPTISDPAVLIVNQGDQLTGIQVDRSWGEQEVAIRRIEGNIPMPAGFNNCIIIGDGRVVPLVNVSELLHWIVSSERSLPTSQPHAETLMPSFALPGQLPIAQINPAIQLNPGQKNTILIVDDSINVRRFLALTLERAGYRVEQAKDGQDALEKLQSGISAQVVICDIEMPRLDGYGFLTKIKANPKYEHLPIAMLTSRSGDKHRQLAMNLGASAYFSKPYNEQDLLQSIKRLVNLSTPVAMTRH